MNTDAIIKHKVENFTFQNLTITFCRLSMKSLLCNHSYDSLWPGCNFVNTEVTESCTAGIFMWDTAHFHCDSTNYESQFIESQWKHDVSQIKMPAVWDSTTSVLFNSFVYYVFYLFTIIFSISILPQRSIPLDVHNFCGRF